MRSIDVDNFTKNTVDSVDIMKVSSIPTWFQPDELSINSMMLAFDLEFQIFSRKSPTVSTERTPKPEYLISLATYLGVGW